MLAVDDGLDDARFVGGTAAPPTNGTFATGVPAQGLTTELLITLAIFGIVLQSGKQIFSRMLDGVDPHVIDEIRHAAAHVSEVKEVTDVRGDRNRD